MILVVGNNREQIANLLKEKGEMIMSDELKKPEKNVLEPVTIKTVMEEWIEGLRAKGLTAFWPSWARGQYIKEDNLVAQERIAKRLNTKVADIREKLVRRHGKNVRVLWNFKTNSQVPTKGMSEVNKAKLADDAKTGARQSQYFGQKNSLDAIQRMMGMPRNLRRTLCRALALSWSQGEEAYLEVEAMRRGE
jgi:hypothetical protein